MTDLISLVLTLQPPHPPERELPAWWGRAAHALALHVIDRHDPSLAARIHDGANAPRPLTASSLWEYRPQNGLKETAYTLRLTGLTAEISRIWLQASQGDGELAPGAVIELDGLPFRILQAAINPADHLWAASETYTGIASPYLMAAKQPPRRIHLRLASPTTFKTGGRHLPIPLPELVFGSLLTRWNAFAPLALPQETRRYAAECLTIQHYRLRSLSVDAKAGGRRIGAVGQVTFYTLNYDRYWMSVLHTLARFALFAGVGAGTPQGLGQVRPLTGQPPRHTA